MTRVDRGKGEDKKQNVKGPSLKTDDGMKLLAKPTRLRTFNREPVNTKARDRRDAKHGRITNGVNLERKEAAILTG